MTNYLLLLLAVVGVSVAVGQPKAGNTRRTSVVSELTITN